MKKKILHDPVVGCHDLSEGNPGADAFHKLAQVIEDRVDLSNNMTWRQMIGVGVRRVVLARGELDKLEGPKYAARRAELRREAGEAARARDRQAAVALRNEAEESGATEEEATGARTTRVGRPRGGIKVAARIGDRLRRRSQTYILYSRMAFFEVEWAPQRPVAAPPACPRPPRGHGTSPRPSGMLGSSITPIIGAVLRRASRRAAQRSAQTNNQIRRRPWRHPLRATAPQRALARR